MTKIQYSYDFEASTTFITSFKIGILEGTIIVTSGKTVVNVHVPSWQLNLEVQGYRYTTEGIRELFQDFFSLRERQTNIIVFRCNCKRFLGPLWLSWIKRHILKNYTIDTCSSNEVTFKYSGEGLAHPGVYEITGFVLSDDANKEFIELYKAAFPY